MAGVTSEGFETKTLADIKAELEAAFQSVFGADVDLDPSGPIGQIIGIVAEREASVWEALEEIYASFSPDQATGAALDAVCALTGTIRRPATKSVVVATCYGTIGATIPVGTRFATSAGDEFETTEEVVLAPSGGGPGTADVTCEATEYGPVPCTAGDLTTIVTPVSGLSSVTNVLGATLGRDEETDAELRVRREAELHSGGTATIDAIREALIGVTGVDDALVLAPTNDDSLEAGTIRCIVRGTGADADDIAAALLDSVAAGIVTLGDASGEAQDESGVTHEFRFDRASGVRCYASVTIYYDADAFPPTGADDAKTAMVEYAAGLLLGRDLVARALGAQVFANVAGVYDCAVLVGTSSPPSDMSVSIDKDEYAELSEDDISVSLVEGEPAP